MKTGDRFSGLTLLGGEGWWEGGLRTSLRNGGLDGTSEQELPNRASFPGFRFEVPFLVQIQIYGGHKDGVFRQGRVPRPIGPKVSQGLLDPFWVLQYQHQPKGFSGTSGSLCFHYGLGSSTSTFSRRLLLHGVLGFGFFNINVFQATSSAWRSRVWGQWV